MQKKIWWLGLLLALLLLGTATASAAVRVATGMGADERAAVHAAMRAAVEAEVGVYVDSRTRVQNYRVLADSIYTQAEGYIASYEIVRSENIGGVQRVTIRADVRSEQIEAQTASLAQRKAVIGANLEDPRVAVIAVDRNGREYPALSAVLVHALQDEGFSRLIDLHTAQAGAREAALALANSDGSVDLGWLSALCGQVPCDYLVRVQVQRDVESLDAVLPGLHKTYITCAAALVNTSTGEITWTGTADGQSSHWYAGAESEAVAQAAQALAPQLASAAYGKAANPQQHLRLHIPQARLGSLAAARDTLGALPGVQHVFVRGLTQGIYTIDLDYDGTASDFVNTLQQAGYTVTHFTAESVIVQ